jgi:hypothetical protein
VSQNQIDTAALIRLLASQQATLGQQLAALVALQTETVHLQRLLVEHALGLPSATSTEPAASTTPPSAPTGADVEQGERVPPRPAAEEVLPLEAPGAPAPSNPVSDDAEEPADSTVGAPPRLYVVGEPAPAESAPSPDVTPRRLHSDQYLQAPTSRAAKHVTRQELDRISRLHDVGPPARLVLQFGEYRGVPLGQIAERDPEYVRCSRYSRSDRRCAPRPSNWCGRSS